MHKRKPQFKNQLLCSAQVATLPFFSPLFCQPKELLPQQLPGISRQEATTWAYGSTALGVCPLLDLFQELLGSGELMKKS